MQEPTYQKLVSHWKTLNYNISYGPTNEVEILTIEKEFGIKLPDDFRKYLLNVCPNPHGGEMDDNYASWWSLKRIKSEGIENPFRGPDYLIFADHCIWAWAWAICCKEGSDFGRIIWLGEGQFLANSFSEFVDQYIRESP